MQKKTRHIAVVEDSEEDANVLLNHVAQYREETKEDVVCSVFHNGLDFLDDYRPVYDIIFMDIEMPHLDGMKTAKKLRALDPYVGLVFITNMAQYAIKGYEVDALDFIVKPVEYFSFVDKIRHIFKRLEKKGGKDTHYVLRLGPDSFRVLPFDDIYYILKDRNYIVYTTREGEFRARGTMKTIEPELEGTSIVKFANGSMVNLRYVQKKVRNSIFVNGAEFTVTRQCAKTFTKQFMEYLRGEKCGTRS